MSVRDNYSVIMENIEKACTRACRKTEDVEFIAVTKFIDEERIAEAIECGTRAVGENRVQEWQKKYDFFLSKGVRMHLIGQLQTNKVKYIINKGVSLIQSVDRLPLAQEIEKQCALHDCSQDVLLEVNIGDEAQKGGIDRSSITCLLDEISALSHVRVKGLMCIPPAVGAEEVRAYFARMRKLYDDLAAYTAANVEMQQLSMGMSGDYTVAIEEGATMVRVGTALFGARI